MSVEGEKWFNQPKVFRERVKEFLQQQYGKKGGKKILSSFLKGLGFVVVRSEEGEVLGVNPVRSEEESSFAGETLNSYLVEYLVEGLANSERSIKHQRQRYGDTVLEEADKRRGHFGRKYRGNHRSHTRGAGMMHNFREGFRIPKNFRGK